MKIITSISKNPFFNIAAEEYLLKNFNEDIIYLYINQPSVICGKHQNMMAEINLDYAEKNNITLVRRISGGGTVYHDNGNLNFCFIQNVFDGNLVDFKRYILPIIELLVNLGIKAELGIKNDIKTEGKKISGNAEHIWKKRVLHHGTLLFDSNLDELQSVLSDNDNNYHSKAVKSNRSETTNIINYLKNTMSISDFQNCIINFFQKKIEGSQRYAFSEFENIQIESLAQQKYSTWEWIFAYSPKYNFKGIYPFQNQLIEIEIEVEKGYITKIEILNKKIGENLRSKIENELKGFKHSSVYKKMMNHKAT